MGVVAWNHVITSLQYTVYVPSKDLFYCLMCHGKWDVLHEFLSTLLWSMWSLHPPFSGTYSVRSTMKTSELLQSQLRYKLWQWTQLGRHLKFHMALLTIQLHWFQLWLLRLFQTEMFPARLASKCLKTQIQVVIPLVRPHCCHSWCKTTLVHCAMLPTYYQIKCTLTGTKTCSQVVLLIWLHYLRQKTSNYGQSVQMASLKRGIRGQPSPGRFFPKQRAAS